MSRSFGSNEQTIYRLQTRFRLPAQKHFSIKPVGTCKYQFAMACIRALVMSAYKVLNCLISQPKHMLWVLVETASVETTTIYFLKEECRTISPRKKTLPAQHCIGGHNPPMYMYIARWT